MTNVTRIEMGPLNFTKKDNEIITTGRDKPVDFIFMQPLEYCVINDPVMRDPKDKSLIIDKHGQVKLKIGDSEIRTAFDYTEPFPLYPGESLAKKEKLPVIPRNSALKLEALRDFVDTTGKEKVKHVAGDEWLEFGPKIYIPRVEAKIAAVVQPRIVQNGSALKVRALRQTKDAQGKERNAGEEWLIRERGFYITGIDETFVEVVNGVIIDDKTALLLEAKQTFTDIYGVERKAGEQWLVTNKDTSTHILDVYEIFRQKVDITILEEDQFCYIRNPKDDKGVNQLGKKVLVEGPRTFFIQPGEEIDGAITKVYILGEDEALLLRSEETHTEADGTVRNAVDRWMVYGPCRYTPPV